MSTQPVGPAGIGNRIKVLVVDDHVILRQALGLSLEQSGYCSVVGYAGDGREAVALALAAHPDVILMDMVMPGLNGIEATRQVRKRIPSARVLVLSAYSDDERIEDALDAGASGYLSKSTDRDELVRAIRIVASGNQYVIPHAVRESDAGMHRPPSTLEQARLSEREREVLQLVAEGRSNREIAEALVLTIKTVESHRASVMRKLSAKSRADLVRFAMDNRITGFDVPPLEVQ